MRVLRRSLGGGIALACVMVVTVAMPSSAHEPTQPRVRSFSVDQLITYKFNGSYPTFMTTAVTTEFETNYQDAGDHNSLAPRLDYSTSGTAKIVYSPSSTSPCTGSPTWIGCVPTGGISSFTMYIRQLPSSGQPGWGWYEASGSCSGITVCVLMKRTALHELGHAIFSFAHSSQGEANTVMGSMQPYASQTGWNRTTWQRCDQASAQLTYGARNVAGPIGECMDHVSGAGSNGLNTVVSLAASDTTACLGQAVTLSGTLRIATNSNYGWLSGDVLGSRVVTIKRDGATWVTRITGSSSGAYSATGSFTTAGSRVYVTSFPNEGSEALTGDSSPNVTVTWSGAC